MKALSRLCFIAILTFLHVPIIVMMAMGFSASPLGQLPFDFTTEWYSALAGKKQLVKAGINSLWIALVTPIVATIPGTDGIGRARAAEGARQDAAADPPPAVHNSTIILIGSMALILIFAIFAKPGGSRDKR